MAGAILITGGAGYIGSHVVALLQRAGQDVWILDDLSNGHADAVPADRLIRGSTGDRALLDDVLTSRRIDAVMHFAAFIEVGASVHNPNAYYANNVGHTLVLLDAMVRHRVPHLVFSSTAAIFGNPQYTPIDEGHPQVPINPYGRSKWMVEQTLGDYAAAHGLESVCLRYFNAAGADPSGTLGERHEPETHLIPLILQAAAGRRTSIRVFGEDYPTPDGTCVRDYIHVQDLAQAHWLALEYLRSGRGSAAFNLGNGNGYSIREVMDAARRATGRDFVVEPADRRPGDPPILVADSTAARQTLGWYPEFTDLARIVEHAWVWELEKGRRW